MELSLFLYLVSEYDAKKPDYKDILMYKKFVEEFDPFDENTKSWPFFFDIENLPPIKKGHLKDMPQQKKGESVA